MEPVAIFEAGTKAIELLKGAIELASKYKSKKKRIFTDYIEPGFTLFQPIIEAYIMNIAKFRMSILSANKRDDIATAIMIFVDGRISVVLNRQKVLGSLLASITALFKNIEKHPRRKREAVLLLNFLSALTQFFRYTGVAENKEFVGIINAPEADLRPRVGSVGTVSVIQFCYNLMDGDNPIRDDSHFNDRKDTLRMSCDYALSLLEARISKLNEAFTELKLECVG